MVVAAESAVAAYSKAVLAAVAAAPDKAGRPEELVPQIPGAAVAVAVRALPAARADRESAS